jgi:hypothetical protein
MPRSGRLNVAVPIRPAGRGHWSAYDVDVPISGTWRLSVRIAVGKFDERQTVFSIPVD